MYYKRSYQLNFDLNGTLLFVQVIIETNNPPFMTTSAMQNAYNTWDSIHNKFKAQAPVGMQNSFQTAMFPWCFIETAPALTNNAFIGIGIALGATFIILLIGTYNYLLAIYATLTVAGIYVSVMACFSFFNWSFGTMESIMSVVVLVFVVRFVALISYSYLNNDFTKTKDRTKMSLKTSGVSIVHSAISTACSSFFLYGATVLILTEFGILVCFTVLYSVLFSLFFLPSLLAYIGPSGQCGDMSCVLGCLSCKCCCQESSDEKQQDEEEKEADREDKEGSEGQEEEVVKKSPKSKSKGKKKEAKKKTTKASKATKQKEKRRR